MPLNHAATLLPQELAAVALVDATACAAAGGVSRSWWYAEVKAGRAPAPVVRQSRFARWRLADVVQFWAEFAERANTQAAELVIARAVKASAAAAMKRAAADAPKRRQVYCRHGSAPRATARSSNCALDSASMESTHE